MAFIPNDAEWYVADLIEEIRVAGRRRNTVWINTVLIEANSPEDAYRKSLEVGRSGNTSYKNVYGERVSCKFRGIFQLNVIYEELKHGCELFFRSKPPLAESGIKRLLRKKQDLAVFSDFRPHTNKRLISKRVADELKRRLKNKKSKPESAK
jgi:hypothetical protein